MTRCLRPQGAPGYFDGYCQLESGHKGDCDEKTDLERMLTYEELGVLRGIFGAFLDHFDATEEESALIRKLGGGA